MSTLKNAGIIRKILKEEGFSEYGIRGSLARLRQESTLNPKAFRKDDAGPGKHSQGILQWNRKRLAALKKFGGANWQDVAVQARFYAKELKGEIPESDESKYGLRLKNAKSDEEAARAAISVARPRHWTPQNPTAGHGWKNTINWTKNWAANQTGESTENFGTGIPAANADQLNAGMGQGRLSGEGGNLKAIEFLDNAFAEAPEGESVLGDLPEPDNSPAAVALQTVNGLFQVLGAAGQSSDASTPEPGVDSMFRSKIMSTQHKAPRAVDILGMIQGFV